MRAGDLGYTPKVVTVPGDCTSPLRANIISDLSRAGDMAPGLAELLRQSPSALNVMARK